MKRRRSVLRRKEVIGSSKRKEVVSEQVRIHPQVRTAGGDNLETKSFSMGSR